MKRIFSILSFLLSLNLLGQLAPVPFSWDASPPMPTGFSTNMASGSEYYISSTCTSLLQNPSSFKLDLGGRFLQMQFASQPGKVRYEIGGQTGSAPYWNGTFKVQGSVDGLVWTDLRVYTGAQSLPSQNDPSNCLLDSVTPADPLTRYVRFFFETKLSGNNSGGGGNVKIDNISISPPPFLIQKLKVYQSGAELFNPGLTQPVQAVVNNTVALPLGLFHVGLSGNLTIQSITITGPASGSYNLSSPSLPLTLTPGNAQVANINFTPNQPGTHQALLTIKSNDPTVDSVFQIQLYGIGGNLASAPAFAPSNLNVSNVKTYRYSIGMNLPLNGPDAYGGYLVLRSEGVPINAVPQNGVNYQRGMSIGNAKVLFVGNPAPGAFAFIPNWILAGRTDEIAAFGYNGTGSYTHYAATSVNASTTTPATMEAPNEYSGIDPSVSTFPADLQALINPHSAIFYSDYIETLIQGFQARDTFLVSGPNIKERVLDCPYSGAPILYQEPFQFGATGSSREHSWPHTWMPTHPADSPEKPEYNDQHNLFPTFQNANSVRCNYPLGEVVNPLVSTGVGVLGLDATGTRVFEPADYHKGRAARAIMYMAACYNSVSGNGWNFNAPMGENCNGTPLNAIQNQDVLKNWHFNYPSTAFDIARNDFLDSLQGNRNPFVDRPDYACYIDFITMAYIPNPSIPCFVTGLNESAALPSNLWPNPAKETVRLKVAGTEGFSYQICDLTGRVLRFGISPEVETQIQVQDLPAGSYLVVLEQNGNRATHRLMVP